MALLGIRDLDSVRIWRLGGASKGQLWRLPFKVDRGE